MEKNVDKRGRFIVLHYTLGHHFVSSWCFFTVYSYTLPSYTLYVSLDAPLYGVFPVAPKKIFLTRERESEMPFLSLSLDTHHVWKNNLSGQGFGFLVSDATETATSFNLTMNILLFAFFLS